MADTTLRAYLRDIDNLIEREKLDEAIAHCRHILQTYPKCIECYRLLGKAYLEAKRYGDAADIFQRVLSAVPDDFVSHIGMSIVREDEGNLDSAIWHMERAFETNPANPAIQQELKRLIGRREGFEPHKVRLTRGALARMYAHGELYPQAIAELRSALQENSDRPDLQVLLAEMYWQTDQRLEAAEVSSQILDKLPYCQQAVRIMAAVFQQRDNAEEAAAYHRRLAQLDPYMAYIEAPMAEPTRVEAETIRIDRLSWQPGQPLPAGEATDSEWATALGLEVGDDEEAEEQPAGPLPSWLDDIEPGAEAEAPDFDMAFEAGAEEEAPVAPEPELSQEPEAPEPAPEPEEPEAGIPEWMSEAGWEPSSGEAEEQPVSFSSEELDALEGGELPAAGPSMEGGEADDEDLAPAEMPDWIQGMAPPSEGPEDEGDEEDLVSMLTQGESGADDEGAKSAADDEAEEPSERSFEEAEIVNEVPGWVDEGEPGATSTIMAWLGGRREPQSEEPDEPADQSEPDWMAEPEAELEDEPDWMAEPEAQAESEPDSMPEADFGTEDEPAWMAEPEPEAEEEPDWMAGPEAEAEVEDEPDWMAELEPEAEEEPDWMAEPGDEGDAEQMAEGEASPADTEGEEEEEPVPTWLSGVAQAAADAGGAEEEELAQFRQQAETQEEDQGQPEVEEPVAEESIPSWLEGIADEDEAEDAPATAEQPISHTAETDELPSERVEAPSPDQRASEAEQEAPPAWLQGFGSDPSEEAVAAEKPTPTPEPTAQEAATGGPEEEQAEDWLAELGAGAEAAEFGEEETEWLSQLGEEEEEPRVAEPGGADEIPGWMEGLEEAEEPAASDVEDLAGTWLEGLSDTLAQTPAEPDEEPEGPEDWFEEITAEEEQPEPEGRRSISDFMEREEEEEEEDLGWLRSLDEADRTYSSEEPAGDESTFERDEFDDFQEDDVFEWLDDLASRQEAAEEPAEQRPMEEQPAAYADAEVSESTAPEPEEEGLEWLEQLAESRGIDADVTLEAEEPIPDLSEELPAPEPSGAGSPDEEITQQVRRKPEKEEPRRPRSREPEPAEPRPPVGEERPARPEPQPPAEKPGVTPEPSPPREPVEPPSPAPEAAEGPPEEEEVPAWIAEYAQEVDAAREPEEPRPPAEPEEPEPASPEAPPEPAAREAGREPELATPEAAEVPEPAPPEPAEPAAPEMAEEPEAPPEPAPPEAPPEPAAPEAVQEPAPAPPEPAEPATPEMAEEPETPPEPAPPEAPPEPATPEAAEVPEPAPPEPAEPAAPEMAEEPEAPPEPAPPEAPPEPAAPEAVQEPAPAPPEPAEPIAPEIAEEREAPPEPAPVEEPTEVEAPTSGPEEAPAEAEPAAPAQEAVPTLETARQALASGDHPEAARDYASLIEDDDWIEQVIDDLEGALKDDVDAPDLWRTLGDAYVRLEEVEEAAKAYERGMSKDELLESARNALASGELERATAQYSVLIKRKTSLDAVIDDLTHAAEEDGTPTLWQSLGDAYMKAGRLDDSIQAYRKGMDSV